MRAGELRLRITIEARTLSQSSAGQSVETWSTAFSSWAGRQVVSGSEALNGSDARVAKEVWKWKVRARSGVTISPATHRLVYNSVQHNIISALPIDETGFVGWLLETERARS